MEITEDHMEYAVVQRLQEMLHDRNPRFRVTSAYAYFSAILCWSAQRMRTGLAQDASAAAVAANGIWEQLSREDIAGIPWRISFVDADDIDQPLRPNVAMASRSFEGRSAQQLIKNLRDSVAHGDARNVVPHNADGMLRGFKFKCTESNRAGNVVWQGTILLGGDDMVRIADELASRFCLALEKISKSRYLKQDAPEIREAA